MIAVIFEVFLAEGKVDEYLDIAASLRPQLEDIDGFISIERFSSLVEEGKILSLSFWRDEEAIEAWRNLESHRIAQEKGRGGVFHDYRLRVANVSRDYGMNERDQAPSDSKAIHAPRNDDVQEIN
jgi:heme-degrading monooxygenase HmoA